MENELSKLRSLSFNCKTASTVPVTIAHRLHTRCVSKYNESPKWLEQQPLCRWDQQQVKERFNAVARRRTNSKAASPEKVGCSTPNTPHDHTSHSGYQQVPVRVNYWNGGFGQRSSGAGGKRSNLSPSPNCKIAVPLLCTIFARHIHSWSVPICTDSVK